MAGSLGVYYTDTIDKGALKINVEAIAGLKTLQNGIYGLRLKYDAENSPVLYLTSSNGEIQLDMRDIYEQAFNARIDGKLAS